VRSSKAPEKTTRDLFIGYLLVFISYAVVGSLGYIGYIGYGFRDYFIKTNDACDSDKKCNAGTAKGEID
jgi:hypothetical protein